LSVPGGLAFLFGIINSRYYTLHDSPLNSVYSILVAIWATLFVLVCESHSIYTILVLEKKFKKILYWMGCL